MNIYESLAYISEKAFPKIKQDYCIMVNGAYRYRYAPLFFVYRELSAAPNVQKYNLISLEFVSPDQCLSQIVLFLR